MTIMGSIQPLAKRRMYLFDTALLVLGSYVAIHATVVTVSTNGFVRASHVNGPISYVPGLEEVHNVEIKITNWSFEKVSYRLPSGCCDLDSATEEIISVRPLSTVRFTRPITIPKSLTRSVTLEAQLESVHKLGHPLDVKISLRPSTAP